MSTNGNILTSHPVVGDMKYCLGCGKSLHKTCVNCPNCGARQMDTMSSKSRLTAALLAFFLGGIGAHKFYLGQTGLGIVYLLFFWTFIPAFIAFIEFIIYLTMSDEKFAVKYP